MSNNDENKNIKAERLYALGVEAFNLKDYKLARTKFSEAFIQCTSDYKNNKKFKDHFEHAEAAILNLEGDAYYNKYLYRLAKMKFQQALKMCLSHEVGRLNVYKSNLAWSNYCLGLRLHRLKKHEGCKNFFDDAHKLFTECYASDKNYKDDMKYVEAAIYNCEGNNLHYQRKCEEAVKKYLQAIEACPSLKVEAVNIYKKNVAGCFQELEKQCVNQKNYEEATNPSHENNDYSISKMNIVFASMVPVLVGILVKILRENL